MKTCIQCGVAKEPAAFFRNKTSICGLQSVCKACDKTRRRGKFMPISREKLGCMLVSRGPDGEITCERMVG